MELEIKHEDNVSGGRYYAALPGHAQEAELTYQRVRADLVIADHTLVPPAARGGGIAFQMVERLIADARDGGYRIVPRCPYIAAQFARHPEWADVLQS